MDRQTESTRPRAHDWTSSSAKVRTATLRPRPPLAAPLQQGTHGLPRARDRPIASVSRATRTWCALLGAQRPPQLLGKGWKVSHLSAPSVLLSGCAQPSEAGATASSCRRTLLKVQGCLCPFPRLPRCLSGLEELGLAIYRGLMLGLTAQSSQAGVLRLLPTLSVNCEAIRDCVRSPSLGLSRTSTQVATTKAQPARQPSCAAMQSFVARRGLAARVSGLTICALLDKRFAVPVLRVLPARSSLPLAGPPAVQDRR